MAEGKSKTEPMKSRVRATFASIEPALTLPTPAAATFAERTRPISDRRHFLEGSRAIDVALSDRDLARVVNGQCDSSADRADVLH